MSEHYHDVGDLRFLNEMGKFAPTEFNAWLTLGEIVGREDGTIPRKYRELIASGLLSRLNALTASRCTSKLRKPQAHLLKKSPKPH